MLRAVADYCRRRAISRCARSEASCGGWRLYLCQAEARLEGKANLDDGGIERGAQETPSKIGQIITFGYGQRPRQRCLGFGLGAEAGKKRVEATGGILAGTESKRKFLTIWTKRSTHRTSWSAT